MTLQEEIILRLAGGTIEADAEDPKHVDREELSRTFYAGLFALPYSQVVAYAAFFADHTP